MPIQPLPLYGLFLDNNSLWVLFYVLYLLHIFFTDKILCCVVVFTGRIVEELNIYRALNILNVIFLQIKAIKIA